MVKTGAMPHEFPSASIICAVHRVRRDRRLHKKRPGRHGRKHRMLSMHGQHSTERIGQPYSRRAEAAGTRFTMASSMISADLVVTCLGPAVAVALRLMAPPRRAMRPLPAVGSRAAAQAPASKGRELRRQPQTRRARPAAHQGYNCGRYPSRELHGQSQRTGVPMGWHKRVRGAAPCRTRATEGGRARSTTHGKSRGRASARPRPAARREAGDHGGQRPRPRQGPRALAGMCAFRWSRRPEERASDFHPTNSGSYAVATRPQRDPSSLVWPQKGGGKVKLESSKQCTH